MADRARREGLRDGPVRLAGLRGRRRRADGAGDVPASRAGSPARRCWAASPACCCASTACTSCSPGWRCSTSSSRSSSSAACTASSPTATGTAPGWPASCPSRSTAPSAWGPVRRLLFRPWLLAAGVCWGLACGTKWEALYPLAAFGLLAWLWSAGARRSFGVRWSLPKSVLADGIPAFVQIVLVALIVYVASWTGWLVNAHTVRGAPLRDPVHRTTTAAQDWPTRRPSRTPTGSARSPSRCGRSGTTTTTSTTSTPTSSTAAPTPTPPSRPAGCCSTGRSASPPTPASSRAPRAATPPRAATACARCCCSAHPRSGGPAAWRCSSRW